MLTKSAKTKKRKWSTSTCSTCRTSTFGFIVSYILMRGQFNIYIFFQSIGRMPFLWWCSAGGAASTGDRWLGSLWQALGGNSLYLFAFVVDPHHWNKNADNNKPLGSGENISCVWIHSDVDVWTHDGVCVRTHIFLRPRFWSFFRLVICNSDMRLSQGILLFFGSLVCFCSDGLARSHSLILPFSMWRDLYGLKS